MIGNEPPNSEIFIHELCTDPVYSNLVHSAISSALNHDLSFLSPDAYQETFFNVLKAVRKTPLDNITYPKSWVYRIARNAAFTQLREYKKFVPKNEGFYDVVRTNQFADIDIAYNRMLVILPKRGIYLRLREVLRHVIDCKKSKDISDILGVSESTISKDIKRLSRIIKRIEISYEKLERDFSERQQQILRYAIDGKQNREIAQLIGISEPLVSKELQAIRTMLEIWLSGPDDDGTGGGSVSSRRKRPKSPHRNTLYKSRSNTRPLISSLLALPAFRDVPSLNYTDTDLSRQGKQSFPLRLLARALLRLPALEVKVCADTAVANEGTTLSPAETAPVPHPLVRGGALKRVLITGEAGFIGSSLGQSLMTRLAYKRTAPGSHSMQTDFWPYIPGDLVKGKLRTVADAVALSRYLIVLSRDAFKAQSGREHDATVWKGGMARFGITDNQLAHIEHLQDKVEYELSDKYHAEVSDCLLLREPQRTTKRTFHAWDWNSCYAFVTDPMPETRYPLGRSDNALFGDLIGSLGCIPILREFRKAAKSASQAWDKNDVHIPYDIGRRLPTYAVGAPPLQSTHYHISGCLTGDGERRCIASIRDIQHTWTYGDFHDNIGLFTRVVQSSGPDVIASDDPLAWTPYSTRADGDDYVCDTADRHRAFVHLQVSAGRKISITSDREPTPLCYPDTWARVCTRMTNTLGPLVFMSGTVLANGVVAGTSIPGVEGGYDSMKCIYDLGGGTFDVAYIPFNGATRSTISVACASGMSENNGDDGASKDYHADIVAQGKKTPRAAAGKSLVASLLNLPAFREMEDLSREEVHKVRLGSKTISTQRLAQSLLELPAFRELPIEDEY